MYVKQTFLDIFLFFYHSSAIYKCIKINCIMNQGQKVPKPERPIPERPNTRKAHTRKAQYNI